MSQKEELPKPVNSSLSDLNLDPHVKTFEFLKRARIKLSGCLWHTVVQHDVYIVAGPVSKSN